MEKIIVFQKRLVWMKDSNCPVSLVGYKIAPACYRSNELQAFASGDGSFVQPTFLIATNDPQTNVLGT